MKTVALALRDQRLVITTWPVTRGAFRSYLNAIGRPPPALLAAVGSATAPVTRISQVEAQAYCLWLSTQEGRRYRLPTLAELYWLAYESAQQGSDLLTWPRQPESELNGVMRPAYLCEWTQETEFLAQNGAPALERSLGSIFYPPWTWNAGRMTHIQASLNTREEYSFVTFRVVYAA